MIKAYFLCDIVSGQTGDIIEDEFTFDNGIFESKMELDAYITDCGYEAGEPCGTWGESIGYYKRCIIECNI